jgi:hypothetical protein
MKTYSSVLLFFEFKSLSELSFEFKFNDFLFELPRFCRSNVYLVNKNKLGILPFTMVSFVVIDKCDVE